MSLSICTVCMIHLKSTSASAMGTNIVPDKLFLFHSACNLVFLMSFCVFLIYKGHLFHHKLYSSVPFLLFATTNEVIKIYSGHLCGLPRSELVWRDDRMILPPSQRTSKLKDFFLCIFILLSMVVAYYIIAVLFGAELLDKHRETFVFSVTLCVLTVFPPCIHLGPNCTVNIICGYKPNEFLSVSMYRNVQFTLFGAWLGAFVIPLDWDRSWQEWPTPCLSGALAGSAFMNIVTFCQFIFRKRQKYSRKSNQEHVRT